ncbi:hypothetical protein, partial [Mesorhizobium sp. M0590]|uniref:hypothetical protein n=1 Tax=unclassified Mesorhizobium TaxID=325217 RepID=UPI00333B0DB5
MCDPLVYATTSLRGPSHALRSGHLEAGNSTPDAVVMADRDSDQFQVRTGRTRHGGAPVNSRTL